MLIITNHNDVGSAILSSALKRPNPNPAEGTPVAATPANRVGTNNQAASHTLLEEVKLLTSLENGKQKTKNIKKRHVLWEMASGDPVFSMAKAPRPLLRPPFLPMAGPQRLSPHDRLSNHKVHCFVPSFACASAGCMALESSLWPPSDRHHLGSLKHRY